MKIDISINFQLDLLEQVHYISKDKPRAARKFKVDLMRNIRKDLKNPFHFKKSIYFDDENIRDYVFKGYTCVYEIDMIRKTVFVFGFIKYKNEL
jgi:plasmid stabilization system protein ParE